MDQKSNIRRIKLLGLDSSKLRSQVKLKKRLANKSTMNLPKTIQNVAKIRALQSTTPEMIKPKK